MSYIGFETRAALVTLYSEPHRHYHNLNHIYDCLAKLEQFNRDENISPFHDIHLIEVAIWFHDVVYNPRSKLNEENSAELFKNSFDLRNEESKKTIIKAILDTKTHNADSGSFISKVLCDIDLSILGEEPEIYHQYCFNIEKEYSFVPKEKYKIGRTQVLNSMLNKPNLYHLDYFKNKYAKQAVENINWELRYWS